MDRGSTNQHGSNPRPGNPVREIGHAPCPYERGVKQVGADTSEIAKSVAADSKQTAEAIAGITTRLAVLEQRFEDLKQSVERREQKRWAVALIAISALVGGFMSVLLQKLLP